MRGTRVIKYWRERNELVLGHSGGIISIFSLGLGVKSPVCTLPLTPVSFRAHSEDITQVVILEGQNRFLSISKDRLLRIWSVPDAWVSQDLLNSYTPTQDDVVTKKIAVPREDIRYNDRTLGGAPDNPQLEDD